MQTGRSEIQREDSQASLDDHSDMTHAMKALRKLKNAKVLSPEEMEELKKRANEKWFKLRGHIHEKKKKDMANILLKRKKNVFTVSSRIELLEEKSKEVFASIKQLNNDLKAKVEAPTHEALRRHVQDINMGMQMLDQKIGSLSLPAMEKMAELWREIEKLREYMAEQLALVYEEMSKVRTEVSRHRDETRSDLQLLDMSCQGRVQNMMDDIDAKLMQMPDYSGAIETLRRALKRKVDIKQLRDLEARLYGHNLDSDDCLIRCLSCHKEVASLQSEVDGQPEESSSPNTKKVNPGSTAGRVYRSSVPFSAEPLVNAGESYQSAGDAYASERGTVLPRATPPKQTKVSSNPSPLRYAVIAVLDIRG
ncbi:TPA: hypothetical protein N0F65_010056 [Lagenidium giganteum]|uniref:Uncharacterized protein n=1 Tax=Lagenidium giganteum TaxID=4803 RepID=A0AAV2ZL98_9STRA|nr:TPA: hypothetical protein N0F65_010056 [Lagenidium giganteum]